MAVRARFYAPLAEYVASRGAVALTLDYRGIGGSRPKGTLRGFPGPFHHWGERDPGGGGGFLWVSFPALPLLWLGHSAGAQLMGLLPDAPIRAALFVGA